MFSSLNNLNLQQEKYDPVLDWKEPSQDKIRQIRQQILEPMKSLTSPVFFSTNLDGSRQEGFAGIKEQLRRHTKTDPQTNERRPTLFVSNHQLLGFDSWLVVNAIQEECGFFVRALTHPFLYPPSSPLQSSRSVTKTSSSDISVDGTTLIETFGCLPVSSRNFYRLLESNQPVLLFPGGAKESFHNTIDQAYQMTAWTTDKVDFVRAAAKFNATVIPFSSVGAAESAIYLKDSLPSPIDEYSTNAIQSILQTAAGARAPTNVRYDATTTNGRQKQATNIDFPLVIPKPIPTRHYYLFGKPLDLSCIDYKNRSDCMEIYSQVKETIRNGCQDLLLASSKHDRYKDPLRRLPYEQLWRRQAPTFRLQVLNENRK